jgi:hypothetical protein
VSSPDYVQAVCACAPAINSSLTRSLPRCVSWGMRLLTLGAGAAGLLWGVCTVDVWRGMGAVSR